MKTIGVLAFTNFIIAIVWFGTRKERRFHREFKRRMPLSEREFHRQYFLDTDIPSNVTSKVRFIYAGFFNLEPELLRPDDRPPELADIDTSELVHSIEESFGIQFTDPELESIDGSLDSVVQGVWKKHRIKSAK